MNTPSPTAGARLSPFSAANQIGRLAWMIFNILFFRFTPRPLHAWRAAMLRLWGAKLGAGCHIYPGAVIWAPWLLECGDGACIASGAEVYNPAPIRIGKRAVISQGAFLCGASHDYKDPAFPLTSAPITIGDAAWVGARAIVLMGVELGDHCVIGAGSVVTKSMPAGALCAGNPCRIIRHKEAI